MAHPWMTFVLAYTVLEIVSIAVRSRASRDEAD